MVDVDLRFDSTSEIPEDLRKLIWSPAFLTPFLSGEASILDMLPPLKDLAGKMTSRVDIYFTIADFIAVHLTLSVPGLSN